MPSRTYPGIGLKGDWDLGEDIWKDENDINLRTASVLLGGAVLSIEAATPGAPAEGDIHIFDATHPTNPNDIAVYDEADWRYIVPTEGLILLNKDDGLRYEFAGGAWSVLAGSVNKYRVGFSIEGVEPDAGEVLLRHVLQTDVNFADDFAGSIARKPPGGGNPAADQVFDILHEDVSVGSVTLATTGTITWVTTAGALAGLVGEEIRIEAPAAPDAAIIGMSFTLYGLEA